MKADSNKKEIQQHYVELQLLDNQLKQVQKQVQLMQAQAAELESLQQALDEIVLVETGTPVFIPLASGIFARARLENSKELLVNIGGSVLVKKSVSDVKSIISRQACDMRELEEELTGQLKKIAVESEKVEKKIDSLTKENV